MRKPNVVLVILDTVRAQNMSCYGHFRTTTPYLEEFASQGILFKQAFTPAVWTIPSHATLFTGTYPSRHGALNLHRFLDGTYATLAEVLSSAGYQTTAFSNNYFLSTEAFGLSRGFQIVVGPKYPTGSIERALLGMKRSLTRMEDCGASSANLFVKRWLRHRSSSERPFFLFLNYMEAHAPYTDIPKRFLNSFLTPAQRKRFPEINQDRQMYLTRSIEMPPEDSEILRSVYDAQISYLDTRIKELLEILKYEDMLDNSLVIITSDHGDMIGEHSLMHHSYCLYEELIKVPLLLKLPGNEGNRKERYDLVSLVDLFPTILDCLGLDSRLVDCKSQGISLLTQDSETHREYVFVECEKPKNEFTETYPDFDFSVYDRQLLAIRSRRHKFIWASDGRHEFYDLEKDPREEHDRIGEDTDTPDRFREELLSWYGSFGKHETTETQKEMDLDQEVKERLQALGYF